MLPTFFCTKQWWMHPIGPWWMHPYPSVPPLPLWVPAPLLSLPTQAPTLPLQTSLSPSSSLCHQPFPTDHSLSPSFSPSASNPSLQTTAWAPSSVQVGPHHHEGQVLSPSSNPSKCPTPGLSNVASDPLHCCQWPPLSLPSSRPYSTSSPSQVSSSHPSPNNPYNPNSPAQSHKCLCCPPLPIRTPHTSS